MMWHVVFAERDGRVQSRAARSRDSAIHVACELLHQTLDVEKDFRTERQVYRAA